MLGTLLFFHSLLYQLNPLMFEWWHPSPLQSISCNHLELDLSYSVLPASLLVLKLPWRICVFFFSRVGQKQGLLLPLPIDFLDGSLQIWVVNLVGLRCTGSRYDMMRSNLLFFCRVMTHDSWLLRCSNSHTVWVQSFPITFTSSKLVLSCIFYVCCRCSESLCSCLVP